MTSSSSPEFDQDLDHDVHGDESESKTVLLQGSRSKRSNGRQQSVDVDIDGSDLSTTLTQEEIVAFIRRIRSLPILYNQDHESFRNSTLKQRAWKEVGDEFGQTVRWCIRKWVSLRDYFVKRKKRLRRGQTLRPWIYYGELSFLNIIYGHDQHQDQGQGQGQPYSGIDYQHQHLPRPPVSMSMSTSPDDSKDDSTGSYYNQGQDQAQEVDISQEFKGEVEDDDDDDHDTGDDPLTLTYHHHHAPKPDIVCQIMNASRRRQNQNHTQYENDYEFDYEPPLEVQIGEAAAEASSESDSSGSNLLPQNPSNFRPRRIHSNSFVDVVPVPFPPKFRRTAAAAPPSSSNMATITKCGSSNFTNYEKNGVGTSSSMIRQINGGGSGGISVSLVTPGILQTHLQGQQGQGHQPQQRSSFSRKRPSGTGNAISSTDSRSILRIPGIQYPPSPSPYRASTSAKRNTYSKIKIQPRPQPQFEDFQESDSVSGSVDVPLDPDSDLNFDLNVPSCPSLPSSNSSSTTTTTTPISHPYDFFCLSIAAQLKKMRRDKALRVQMQIMNLIYQSEFSQEQGLT